MSRKNLVILPLLTLWGLIYFNLEWLMSFLVYDLADFEKGTHLSESVFFFIFEVPKVLLLLTIVVFAVGIIRSYFSPERTRELLGGKKQFFGNIMAGLLGVVTPFCSCSAIPLFLGFIESGVPLGVTFSFLISAPMVNEVAIVLLFGLFGWKTALIYVVSGLTIAIISGTLIGKLRLEKYVEDWVYKIKSAEVEVSEEIISFNNRIDKGFEAVRDILRKVWLFVVLGIAVGAGIHGYAPEDFMASFMGSDTWWSVPLSVLLGIPMYSNAVGIIPVVQALLEKGASLGTVLAFMMSVIALSLPEMIILRKVLKLQLILAFAGIVGTGIMITGFLFNFIF